MEKSRKVITFYWLKKIIETEESVKLSEPWKDMKKMIFQYLILTCKIEKSKK